MISERNFWFPSCSNSKDLYYRTVLIEKIKEDKYTVTRCCSINGIPIFSDSFQNKNEFRIGKNSMGNLFILSGIDLITITTDSAVIKNVVNAIEDYKHKEYLIDTLDVIF